MRSSTWTMYLLLTASAILWGFSVAAQAGSAEQSKKLMKSLYEHINSRDLDQLSKVVDENVALHVHSKQIPAGIESLRTFISSYLDGFSDLQITPLLLIAEDDRVTAMTKGKGTHDGVFAGIPPTGHVGDAISIDTARIANGKIVELWIRPDEMTVMENIGALPPEMSESSDTAVALLPEDTPAMGGSALNPEDMKMLTHRMLEDVWSKGDLSALDEIVSPNYVDRSPRVGPTGGRDREAFKSTVTMYRSAYPDLEMTAEDIAVEGDLIVIRWIAQGTHKGEIMGVPPTDQVHTVTGTTIARVEGKQVADDWTVFDLAGWLRQLGVMPD